MAVRLWRASSETASERLPFLSRTKQLKSLQRHYSPSSIMIQSAFQDNSNTPCILFCMKLQHSLFSEERVVFARTLWYIALFGLPVMGKLLTLTKLVETKLKGKNKHD
jgi:hypothetical protein